MQCRTIIARIVALALLLGAAGAGIAQENFPSRPVRYIVPYPPGGSTDPVARFMGAKLGERWGQSVVVQNVPGGATVIGMSALARATPDGYTVGWAGAGFFSSYSLIRKLPYDPLKDFMGVATLSTGRNILVLHPSVPANNLKEFIAYAKSKPAELNFATSGYGTNTHLSAELFMMETGVKLAHVAYKGSGPATLDLLGGRVQLSFQVPITVLPMIKGGKLKPIALSGEGRLPMLPDVPTYAELGLPGAGLTSVTALVAPAGTPRNIVARISEDVAAILKTPAAQEFFTASGAEPFISATAAEADKVIKTEIARYAKIIKTAGIKPQH